MIAYKLLQNTDSSLTSVHGNPESLELVGISHSEMPESGKFIFIKNDKFYKNVAFLTDAKVPADVGLILPDDYFKKIKETETYSNMQSNFAWIATVNDLNVAMCLLSKPFYDEKFAHLNYHVDGRQMGSCEIDPDAQIAQNVFIGENCKIGKNVTIMPGATIMAEVEIGEGSTIFPNVSIYPYSKIGKNCRIHSATVIGGDGFGYHFHGGKHEKIWHFSGVIIHDDVEIGGGSFVDCGAFMPTIVGEGTKIDNMCQISHNSIVGKHNIFCGKSGVSGSCKTGDYVVFGAASGAANGVTLGKGVQVASMAIISENKTWPEGTVLAGVPAKPIREWMRQQAKLRRLADKS